MSILDTKSFKDCRSDPSLMRNSIIEFLKEKGFTDEEMPPDHMISRVYTTFCATIAIRGDTLPQTPMRKVVEQWDAVMMSYALARSMKDVKAMQDAPRIVTTTH